MSVEVTVFDDLGAVARDAGGALDREAQPSLFDRLDWFDRTAAHCPPGGKPMIARARNGLGTAWLFLSREGSSAQALASWYTLDFDIVRSGDAKAAVAALARNLDGISHISLAPVADPAEIADAFLAAGWQVFIEPTTVNWRTQPPADFDVFWESRPSRLRNTVKRKAKKADLDIRIHRSFDADAWEAYRAIYAASWKPEEGSWDFMRSFADAEGAAGTLRLGIAYHDGAPVAAQLWHVENGRATIHKLAYVDSAKDLSPGSILSHAMFRHVIEQDRPDLIDYGTGDQPYKADWMDEALPLYRIECYHRRRPSAWPRLARRMLSELVRRPATH
ncbi:GNAT family N-acetyltransferase [Sphingomonas japonica]|uniref:BioF2-like acetyltransferase domain-containing protein n=1 Tax=Sphingomonas japonica TaxID=511662 RepID=A0ABX0U3C2_9SPHN|nr:GNAT family N-acetyltransferase [Sphingomonas japonica]NIJ25035.1 hypothetical protein [Sphingomonas japonica]